jgi:hypothetical protein
MRVDDGDAAGTVIYVFPNLHAQRTALVSASPLIISGRTAEYSISQVNAWAIGNANLLLKKSIILGD